MLHCYKYCSKPFTFFGFGIPKHVIVLQTEAIYTWIQTKKNAQIHSSLYPPQQAASLIGVQTLHTYCSEKIDLFELREFAPF